MAFYYKYNVAGLWIGVTVGFIAKYATYAVMTWYVLDWNEIA
jgi:hypothetical protein